MKHLHSEVNLRPFRLEDVPQKVQWINDPRMNRHLHYHIPINVEDTKSWFLNKDNQHRRDCVIEYEGKPVGLIGLLAVDEINQKAEYYISLGAPEYEHRGIASAATVLILQLAFFELGLNKVYLNVDAENEAACHLYERCGFRCEGFFRQELMHRGHLIDRKRYAILREEFEESKESE